MNETHLHPSKRSLSLFSFSLALAFVGCAGKPTFQPEVGGEGGKFSHGGVIYSIPAKKPLLKMKLVSMVIPKKTMVHVRMFFLRKGPAANEYLDPREQSIVLPDSETKIYPSRVHASDAGKPMIKLADSPKQAVELLFQLPAGGHEYPFINLNWKIHYRQEGKDLAMAETERFDYVEKADTQRGVGEYDGYEDIPYVGWSPIPEVWMTPGWMWW